MILNGILLCPSLKNFVSQVVIDVFIVARKKRENPVTTLLANTYVAPDLCYEKKVKRLTC